MKCHLERLVAISFGLLILGPGFRVFAAEPGPEVIIRNALDKPLQVDLSPSTLNVGTSRVNPHWELTLKGTHGVMEESRSDTLALGVRVYEAQGDKARPEITRCESTLTKTSDTSKIAVIIHNNPETKSPRCDIVDISSSKEVRRIALRNSPVL